MLVVVLQKMILTLYQEKSIDVLNKLLSPVIFEIDFAKWINMENIDMMSKDTWHHPYEDVNREINSKELFELFLENY